MNDKVTPSHPCVTIFTSESVVDRACRWHEFTDERTLQQAALDIALASAAQEIHERDQFHLVLASCNTPHAIYQKLRTAQTDWSAWHIYFGDERCLPPSGFRSQLAHSSRSLARLGGHFFHSGICDSG